MAIEILFLVEIKKITLLCNIINSQHCQRFYNYYFPSNGSIIFKTDFQVGNVRVLVESFGNKSMRFSNDGHPNGYSIFRRNIRIKDSTIVEDSLFQSALFNKSNRSEMRKAHFSKECLNDLVIYNWRIMMISN